jgi:hypothetical protein
MHMFKILVTGCFSLQELGLLASSDLDFTSETVTPFRRFDMTPWMGDQPVASPLYAQDSKTQKTADMQPFLERDSNSQSQSFTSPRPYAP